ncbi:hypothetical protein AAHA92_32563 [Salvia divinorum]|uniref:Uncharacterized protein n=1 Tax=Salvia divinorum TaxID=28513 RepID=A0ABD1FL62_SALDI
MEDVETEVTCGSLLESLQQIWDEVGETNEERDRVLLKLDRDCLDVYKREFDEAVKSRAHLLHTLADARDKLTNLLSVLGEKTYVGIPEITSGTIKEQLEAIAPALERLSKLRDDTIKEFHHVRVEEDPSPSPEGKGASNTPCEGKKNYSLEETKLLASAAESSEAAVEEKFLVLSEKMGSVGEAIMIKSYLKALEKDTSMMSETKRQQHEAAVKLLACKLGLV